MLELSIPSLSFLEVVGDKLLRVTTTQRTVAAAEFLESLFIHFVYLIFAEK